MCGRAEQLRMKVSNPTHSSVSLWAVNLVTFPTSAVDKTLICSKRYTYYIEAQHGMAYIPTSWWCSGNTIMKKNEMRILRNGKLLQILFLAKKLERNN